MILTLLKKTGIIKSTLICAIIILTGISGYGQDNILNKRISVSFPNLSLLNALNLLSTAHSLPLSYDPEFIPAEKKTDKNFVNEPVAQILNALLAETGLGYKILQNEIIIVPLDKVSINGRIVDGESGEDLIGATLYIPKLKQGVKANNYGFYSLTIPPGTYEVQVSHIGYASVKTSVALLYDKNQVFRMKRQISELQEVQVQQSSEKDSVIFLNPGKILGWNEVRQQRYFKGESDVVKALQQENGITSLTEGSSYMFIRGGNKDQNLIILDEANVYNPAHLFGLTSIFNPDALKNIQIYTAGIPANLGGRLSSVIDVRMADGDDKQVHIKGGISLLSARISVEGPIVKGKGSFLLAARKSLNNLLNQDLGLFELRPSYYDLNFKANYRLGINDRLYISAYVGKDRVRSANTYLNTWGNQTSTLRWNHVFNPKLFFNLSAIYSNYKNGLSINADSSQGTNKWITGIRDFTVKGDFTHYANPTNQFQYGFNEIFHLFIPGESRNEFFNNISRFKAGEQALYFSHSLLAWKALKVVYGIRASVFSAASSGSGYNLNDQFEPVISGNDNRKAYARFEPRLSMEYTISTYRSLQFNYNRNYQYLQLVQNDELAFSSLESWIPSGINLSPQRADFISVGYKDHFFWGKYSIDLYYKELQNQLELVDHAQLISNTFIESALRSGYSNAYGLELSLSKDIGRFKGTALYSFSRVYRTISGINDGMSYPAGYDIPHSLKLNFSYQLSKTLSFNSIFSYSSGRPVTLPIGYFEQKGLKVPIYGKRNSSRMPDYHRLDLTLQWVPQPLKIAGRHLSNTFSAGVYNVYNHKNPLFYRINQQNIQELKFYRQSFSGATLGLSYSFKF